MENNLGLGISYHVEVERIAAEEEEGLQKGDHRARGVVSSTNDGNVKYFTLPYPNFLYQSEKYSMDFSHYKAEYYVFECILLLFASMNKNWLRVTKQPIKKCQLLLQKRQC